jgi:membrane protease YdiL (CAAX protease family)
MDEPETKMFAPRPTRVFDTVAVVLVGLILVSYMVPLLPKPDNANVFVWDWGYRVLTLLILFRVSKVRVHTVSAVIQPLPPRTLAFSVAATVVIIVWVVVSSRFVSTFDFLDWSINGSWPTYGEHVFIRAVDLMIGLFLVALTEELIFRVLLIERLERRFSSRWIVYLLGILLFSFAHWSSGFGSVIVTAGSAVILIWLFRRTRSVWPPTIAHYAWNLLAFT